MNMLATITSSNVCTMSSREIAELTEKDHAHVMRDIRAMLEVLKKDASSFGAIYHDAYGREKPCFNLPKRETLILVSGYSTELRARIIDRWQELETMIAPPPPPVFKVPTTFAGALRLALEQAELIEQQTALIAQQAPAVAYVEKFVKADGLIGVREAAKSLGLNQNAFVNMLLGAGLMFRENGHLQAYAGDIDAGRFVVQAGTDSTGKARASTKFTAKGLRWVASKLRLDQLFQD